ncbi:PaaX family transcriptional regulator C-terminal domain-containing protein [Roseovarius salinarum]|uniref:PaaX family transcriptional regulator C-terminal domain-containing protein n=1 Tax=Roseovarius salinarum TaxID=1981892 RepID=UPI000C33DE2A|nr:PaaX family transcriptional regulator C-terminal domain-containing protein [Roseovarius salinarum]
MQILDTQEKIDVLSGCGPLKVWSVVVTILGDMCTTPDDRIGGKLLTALAGRMGVTAQAVRVAVHRLRADGWIESEKAGRESLYGLSGHGWTETQAVRPVIYSGAMPTPGEPWLIVAPPHLSAADFTARLPATAIGLGPRTALVETPPTAPDTDMLLARARPDHIPGWLVDLLADGELRSEYDRLGACTRRAMAGPRPDNLLDSTVLRLLILHHWRRLRLRHGALPDMLLQSKWEGARARRAVAEALEVFPRPALPELAAAQEDATPD